MILANTPIPAPPPLAATVRRVVVVILAVLASLPGLSAQELEPRRWGHLPVGSDFAGLGYIRTEGDIALDPVLRLTDVEVEVDTAALKYIRTFELFGKSARFDLVQAYQKGDWTGLLDGVPASAERSGFTDTALRFAINLFGAPPLEGKEFAQYRAGLKSDTIIGAGLIVTLPTGEYFCDKLINLGENRFSFRPQVGVVHERGKWSFEFTGATWFFTGNDDFFGGKELEQDPLVTMQGHVILHLPARVLAGGEPRLRFRRAKHHRRRQEGRQPGGAFLGCDLRRAGEPERRPQVRLHRPEHAAANRLGSRTLRCGGVGDVVMLSNSPVEPCVLNEPRKFRY